MNLVPVAAARSDTTLPSAGTQASDQEEVASCYVFVSKGSAQAYQNPGDKEQPEEKDLIRYSGLLVTSYVTLGKSRCEQFIRGQDRYFRGAYSHPFEGQVQVWFEKSDFVLESQLTPIGRWTTRYVYTKSSAEGAVDSVGVMTQRNVGQAYFERDSDEYSPEAYRSGVELYSPDAYRVEPESNRRWKLYLLASDVVVAVETENKQSGPLVLGEAGLYGILRCSRTGPLTCGYKEGSYSHVTRLPKELNSAVQVRDDKIVLTRRLIYEWPLIAQDSIWSEYKVFGEFSDPVRPLVYAPGVLFKPETKSNSLNRYRPEEMVQEELCVADCPDQLPFQQPRPKPVQPPAEKPGFFSRLWSAFLRWLGL
ncbi:hypothetical protein AAD027_18700 [Pseudoxanthomonas putridarboris]|uniref:DKNYY family protein n=2 Tax=Pseudoxanthomonas putridarboris TaxID=752605 RepID=A0ABU9J564_9GAMM